ncbi:hypothetical protein ACM66B_001847 [Microbotryomycetes sp. NB124-2]
MQNAPTPSHAYSSFLNVGSPAFSPPAGASPSAAALTRPSPAPSSSSALPRTTSAPLLPPQLSQQTQLPFVAPPASAAGHRSARAASVASRANSTAHSIVDINLESRKAYTLLVGSVAADQATTTAQTGAGGLLDKLELEFEAIMHQLEHAYDQGDASKSNTTAETLLATMDSVVQTLQSSALGGFPLPTPQTQDQSLQQRIDTASTTVQKLFRERQRAKEGADVASNVLNSA